MTTGNANTEDMTDAELEAAQLLADGEKPGTDPVVGGDADTTTTDANDADTGTGAKVDEDKADPAAPDVGGEAKDEPQPERAMGVASKDGTRILPYAALQAERRTARSATARADAAEEELAAAKQLIADMKAGKAPASGAVTEDDVRQMEEDFPEQGKKMRALFEANKALETSKPAAATKADVESDDPVQEAIDQVPLLVEWQHGDAEKFERAQALDRALVDSPKWRDKPAVERFEHVAKLVAEEYDIQIPEPKASKTKPTVPSKDPVKVIADAQRTAPNTLSDFKGGDVAEHGSADLTRMAPTAMLNRFMDMTDEEMDRALAKLG